MKRDRDQSEAPSERPAESRASDHPEESSNEILAPARSKIDYSRCRNTKPCSVVIQRLSEAALRRLIQQSDTKARKLSDGGRDVGGTPVANPIAGETQVSRDVGCFKKDSMAPLYKKGRSNRETQDKDTSCRKDRYSSFLERDDEAGCRSEELADIINFLIQTEPKGRKDDYVANIQDALLASTPEVYGFAYDPKIMLNRGSDSEFSDDSVKCERVHDIHQHNRTDTAGSSPDGGRKFTTSFSAQRHLICPRESSDENLLESKPTQSVESLVSSSDSEGRLVIDEGNDVIPDKAVLAEAYRDNRNGESACEDTLTRRENKPGPTSLSDAVDKASPEGSCSDVASCVVVNEKRRVDWSSDELVKEKSVSESSSKSSSKEMNKESEETEGLVWLPYISHTMSSPNSGELSCETTPVAEAAKNTHEKEGKSDPPAAKGDSRKTRFDNSPEKHRRPRQRESSLRKKRTQPDRLCRSQSADATPRTSKFLSVYTTVRDGKITSVDCKRYRKRRRHSVSRERASSKSTSDEESRERKRPSEKQKEVDVYVTVSKVVRDMMDTTACDMQDITKDSEITDPKLKHLFRAFCDSNGYRYEDFMSEGTEHVPSRVLTPDIGEAYNTRKRQHHLRNSRSRCLSRESTSSPKKRRKDESPCLGGRILTRSQRKKSGPEKVIPYKSDHYEVRDVFPNSEGSMTKTRVPPIVPELYSSNTESSVDLSDAIASLDIDCDTGKDSCVVASVEQLERDNQALGQNTPAESETPICDFAVFRAPDKRTDNTKEALSFGCAKSDTKENVHQGSAIVPRAAECIESDNDEDRLVICDCEPEAETVNPCSDVDVSVCLAENETVNPRSELPPPCTDCVSEGSTIIPPDCDTVDETLLCVSDVPVKEKRRAEGRDVEGVSEEVLQQCNSGDTEGNRADKENTAAPEEKASTTGGGSPVASPKALPELEAHGDTETTSQDKKYSEAIESRSLNELTLEAHLDAGNFCADVVSKREAEDVAGNVVQEHALDDVPEDVAGNVVQEHALDDVPEVIEDTEALLPDDLSDIEEGKNLEEPTAHGRVVEDDEYLGNVTTPCQTESATHESNVPRRLPGHEMILEFSEDNKSEKDREGDVIQVVSDNSNDYQDVTEQEKSISTDNEIMTESNQIGAEEDNLQDCKPMLPAESVRNENVDPPSWRTESTAEIYPADLQISCTADIKEEPVSDPSEGHSVVMDTSSELPLDLSLNEATLPKPKSDVPVGTVHPQVATTDDTSKSGHNFVIDDDMPINYSCKSSSRRKAGLRPTHIVDMKQDKSKYPDPESTENSSSESILQRLLLDSTKNDKIAESGCPLPVIIDVRSLRPEMEVVEDIYSKSHVLSDATMPGNSTRLDSKQQQPAATLGRQCPKASVSVPPMTFPENRQGMSTLQSKILELKKQIHHLTILATYKEKELGCIRNLRLAKEEALKQLECKYPAIFSSPNVNRRNPAPLATTFHTDVPDIVTKAATVSSSAEFERNFRAAQHHTAFADAYLSNQPPSKDSGSGLSGFRKIAPKQPSYAATEDRHPHVVPLAGPFWLPDISVSANTSPKSPRRHIQGFTASHPAYQLPALYPWWNPHPYPYSGAQVVHNDIPRESSSISPPSTALLDCQSVQSHTARSTSFAETPRSVASDSDDCAHRTSNTLRRDCSSSDVYAGQTSVSPDQTTDTESVLQSHALHMYEQLLQCSREKDPLDIAATLLREKQLAVGYSASQSRAFYNAVDTWMKLSQNVPESFAASSTARRKSNRKAMPQATFAEQQFSEQRADSGHYEASSPTASFRPVVCVNCGDPRVKYVCNCCRTQTFCSEQCQMQLWSHRNAATKAVKEA